jgi:carbon monoxide dehydrogenase subunit G
MELIGTQTLPVSQQIAWAALNDPEILKASITGCEELTRVNDTEFSTAVTAAVGPVKARFKAVLTLADVRPPTSYTIRFNGQGGVAGFGKGDAQVTLTPEGDNATRLDYIARASVGGKLAQIGSRLVDATAKKMADEFFTKFNAELKSRNAQPDARAPSPVPDHAGESPRAASLPPPASPGVRPLMVALVVLAIAAVGYAVYHLA